MEQTKHDLTPTELARLGNTTRQRIYRGIHAGRLKARCIGGTRYLISIAEAARFLDLPVSELEQPEVA